MAYDPFDKERHVREGIPTALDAYRHTQVGRSVPRYDGPEKIKGEAVYADDMFLPNMAYAKIKRAPHAHAIIKKIDCTKALSVPGVLAVMVGEDLPNKYGIVPASAQENALAIGKVRFYGEGVAAVCALEDEIAEEALELIEVEYEELPALLTPQESIDRAKDIKIHEDHPDNIFHSGVQIYGDPEGAFKKCDYVVERTFTTSKVSHNYIEPHAALAHYNHQTNNLHVWSAGQSPHYLHRQLSIVMEMPMNRIRVTLPHVGGGFGGKMEASPPDFISSYFSRKVGRPVKCTYERNEVFFTCAGRHPCYMNIKLGMDKEGKLQAMRFDNTLDKGAYNGWGIVVMFYTGAMVHLPYAVPHVHTTVRSVYTNTHKSGAMRGLGGVQPRYALECLVEELAEMINMEPLDFKLMNAIDSGYTCPNNMYVPHCEVKQCMILAAEKSNYREKHGKLPFGKGIGLAAGFYISGTAYTLYQAYRPHTTVLLRVDAEGGVTLHCACADIGQGAKTVAAQMAAEALGVLYEDVHVQAGDTELGTFDLGTFASRVTYAIGSAIIKAAEQVNEKIKETAGQMLGCRADQLVIKGRKIYSMYETKKIMNWEDAVNMYNNTVGAIVGLGHFSPPRRKGIDIVGGNRVQGANIGHSPTFGFSCQVHEVDVDLETGKVQVTKVTEYGDCGTAINPMSVHGQVEGSVMYNLGQVFYEQMKYDEKGKLLNPNFHDYKMPGSADLPDIDANVVDTYDFSAPFGVKETGEGAVQPTIPAINEAIYDAIGVRFYELPVTPEMILEAIKDKKPAK
jgi:4-hydroxybenzoyl-CoA reductase subunit alpha